MTWTTALNILSQNCTEQEFHDNFEQAGIVVADVLFKHVMENNLPYTRYDDIIDWVFEGDYNATETPESVINDYVSYLEGGDKETMR